MAQILPDYTMEDKALQLCITVDDNIADLVVQHLVHDHQVPKIKTRFHAVTGNDNIGHLPPQLERCEYDPSSKDEDEQKSGQHRLPPAFVGTHLWRGLPHNSANLPRLHRA